jgi:hypothetical protein
MVYGSNKCKADENFNELTSYKQLKIYKMKPIKKAPDLSGTPKPRKRSTVAKKTSKLISEIKNWGKGKKR